MNALARTPHRLLLLASLLLSLLAVPLTGCDGAPDSPDDPGTPDAGTDLTYYRDTKAIIDSKCASCHRDGDIAPFPLGTYEEVAPYAAAMAGAIASGAMPPWQPDDACNSYRGDFSLSDAEQDTLLAWLQGGAPAGDPADHPADGAVSGAHAIESEPFVPDVTLQMAEPYLPPEDAHDDYRCFLLEWPETEPVYVTGSSVTPDQRGLVHHVILFRVGPADADTVRALDAAEDGPGYTCFGGPLPDGQQGSARLGQLGGWVPGSHNPHFPAGTGIRVEPGSLVVMQMHYHLSHATPAADRSSVGFALATEVEQPAILQLFTNPRWLQPGGMPIPAGDSDVSHAANMDLDLFVSALDLADDIDLETGGNLVIHSVGMHMHELGKRGRVGVLRGNGSQDCLLDIPDWDFHWQGSYTLATPVTVGPNDFVQLQCWWDNSAANQPHHGSGEPQDTEWGEGTGDEMCLTPLYITAE